MKKLYVISKYDNYDIIKYNTVEIEQETVNDIFLSDKIEGKYKFPKENLDKEFEYLFVTKDKRKVKKQLKRIYNNIENDIEYELSKLNYKIEQLKDIQKRNMKIYNDYK